MSKPTNAPNMIDSILQVLKSASDAQGKVPFALLERVMKELRAIHNIHDMREELEEIAHKLEEATTETKALLPDEQFANAAQELNAAIEHTETAANEIMDAAEAAMALSDDPKIQEKMMEIITACNFQDISGQRIRKVARVLSFIEPRIRRLIELLVKEENRGEHLAKKVDALTATAAPAGGMVDDTHLKNGPQLPGQGISQADIDRLFDES